MVSSARLAELPRVKFICGRDLMYGPNHYEIGVLWAKRSNVAEGEIVYSKWFILRLRFRLWIDRE